MTVNFFCSSFSMNLSILFLFVLLSVVQAFVVVVRPSSKRILQGASSDDPPLPPGRPTRPILRWFFDDTANLLNPRDMKLLKRKNKFGAIFKTNFLFTPCVFVADEASIDLLAKQEARTTLQAFFPPHHKKLFGPKSVLVQSGGPHLRLRRLLMTGLNPTMVAQYDPQLVESVSKLLDDLQRESSQDFTDVVPKLRIFFTFIVLQVVLGTSHVSEALVNDISTWSKGLLAPPLTFLPFTTAGKAIKARKRVVAKLNALMDMQPTVGLLATLMNAQSSAAEDDDEPLTRDEILDNLFTLVFAGADTTASAAVSIWIALSIQQQLKQELKEHPDRIESFVEQVLEANPPAPFSMRQVVNDIQLGEYRVPSKWLVAYGFASALDGRVIPSETQSSSSSTPVSSSLVFGRGPRRCPGRYLASRELIIFTKELLNQIWVIEPDQDLEKIYTPGFFPVDGFKVRFP